MEVQSHPAPIIIHISHADFRRLLQSAREVDQKYRWLRQFEFILSLAVVDDWGVTIKLA
jgi:hypothetical protein